MGSMLRRLAGAQLRQAAVESALSPGELVESMTIGPSYFALKPTSEHSVVAAVESSTAVAGYLLQQQSGVQRLGPGLAGRGAVGVPRVLPGSSACLALAGGRCCREYSSADKRLGSCIGGGWGRLLTVIGACADGGRLESVDPRVGSDKPCAPEDEDESAIVSRPTLVLNPVLSCYLIVSLRNPWCAGLL